jgi:hypothetical protein
MPKSVAPLSQDEELVKDQHFDLAVDVNDSEEIESDDDEPNTVPPGGKLPGVPQQQKAVGGQEEDEEEEDDTKLPQDAYNAAEYANLPVS